MDVPITSCILDKRLFKTQTFSDYKKGDVVRQMTNNIINKKLEEACYWMVELHISGKLADIWIQVNYILGKYINIANPNLCSWILFKIKKYSRLIEKFDSVLDTRNNQEIRNLLVDVIAVITLSDKNKYLEKMPPKMRDVNYKHEMMKSKIINKNIIIGELLKKDDHPDIVMALNQVAHGLIGRGTIEDIIYWITWVDKYDKFTIQLNKQSNKQSNKQPNKQLLKKVGTKQENGTKEYNKQPKKEELQMSFRNIPGVSDKYCKNYIWLLWDIILSYSESEEYPNILFNIYKHNFNLKTKVKKQYLIYSAILFIRKSINREKIIINKYHLRLQACCNINRIYKLIFNNSKQTFNTLNEKNQNINNNVNNIKNNVKNIKNINLNKTDTKRDLIFKLLGHNAEKKPENKIEIEWGEEKTKKKEEKYIKLKREVNGNIEKKKEKTKKKEELRYKRKTKQKEKEMAEEKIKRKMDYLNDLVIYK